MIVGDKDLSDLEGWLRKCLYELHERRKFPYNLIHIEL